MPPKSSYKEDANFKKIQIGSKYIGYIYLTNPKAKYAILHSHGNAEDIGLLYPLLKWYQAQGFAVMAYDYPGYGISSGPVGEATTYAAITKAYMLLREDFAAEDIILIGRSLGSAPSLYLAAEHKVGAILLEAPFLSAFRVITQVPLFPVDRFNNLNRLKAVTAPISVIHGTRDTIVPFSHGKKLYSKVKNKKQFYPVSGAGHNNLYEFLGMEEYVKILQEVTP